MITKDIPTVVKAMSQLILYSGDSRSRELHCKALVNPGVTVFLYFASKSNGLLPFTSHVITYISLEDIELSMSEQFTVRT